MTEKNDFSVGSVSSNILRLAIPMTLAQLINILYNLVDRVFIGHIPDASTEALTGVGLALPVITMITAFANLFGMGGAPLFSMARGAGNEDRAGRVMGNSFSMLLLSGITLTVLGLLFKKPLLYAFGASSVTFPYADAYLSIYLCGTLFVMTSLGMNNFINAQGFGLTGMLTVSIGAILNLILDPLFIFLLGMGVRGAALATILSQLVSAIWVMHFLTGKKAIIPLRTKMMKISLPLVKEIAALGLASFVMFVTNGSVQIVCNATLHQYGGDLYVGIMTVLTSLRELVSMPIAGLSSGAQPVMSFNYGAGLYDRVKKAINFTTLASIAISTLCWALTFFCPRPLIHLFNSEPELLTKGVPAMKVYFFGFFMMSLQFAGQTTFTALGKAKRAIFFSLFRKVLIVIPLTLLLPMLGNLGTMGVFLAEPISNFIGGTACFSTMLLTVYRKLGSAEKGS